MSYKRGREGPMPPEEVAEFFPTGPTPPAPAPLTAEERIRTAYTAYPCNTDVAFCPHCDVQFLIDALDTARNELVWERKQSAASRVAHTEESITLRAENDATRAELAREREVQAGRDKVVEMAAARVTEIAAERDAARAALERVEKERDEAKTQYAAVLCRAVNDLERERDAHAVTRADRRLLCLVDHVEDALAATPTPPAAVAALVRAARERVEEGHSGGCGQGVLGWLAEENEGRPLGACTCGHDALAVLLDAPPWRDLR